MFKEFAKIIARIFNQQVSEEDLNTIDALEKSHTEAEQKKTNVPAELPKTGTPASPQVAENSEMAELKKRLAEFEKQQEEALKAQNAFYAQQQKERIDKIILEAKAKGKIPAKNEELEANWRRSLQADIDATMKVLEAIPENPAFSKSKTEQPAGQQQTQSAVPQFKSRHELAKEAAEAFAVKTN